MISSPLLLFSRMPAFKYLALHWRFTWTQWRNALFCVSTQQNHERESLIPPMYSSQSEPTNVKANPCPLGPRVSNVPVSSDVSALLQCRCALMSVKFLALLARPESSPGISLQLHNLLFPDWHFSVASLLSQLPSKLGCSCCFGLSTSVITSVFPEIS